MKNTILIVDDQPELRSILRQVLEDVEFECLEAGDGDIAFEMLRDRPSIDLVVIDFKMPRMNGLQLLTSMNAHPVLMSVPTVFITAEHSESLRTQAIQSGANHVLFKPFDLKEFKSCVHSLVASLHAP